MRKVAIWVLAGFAVACLGCAGDKFEQEVKIEQAAVGLANQFASGGYRLVTTAELKAWIDARKEMTIVDTMPYADSYRKEHIPGAKQFLFPIAEMKTWDVNETGGKTPEDWAKLLGADKNRPIVVYCGFVKCTRSHNGALWAVKLGYTEVYRHPGGVFAWKGAGYPVEGAK
jgi:rhodanese-related sulfurtransferase